MIKEIVINNTRKTYSPAELGLETAVESPAVHAVALAVRVHRQNSRQGTVGCKDRTALVSRSNRKPWRQKGTGRARAGTARSPLWRGGAVSHGPQARVRTLAMPTKVNHLALRTIVAKRALKETVISLSWTPVPKSKAAFNLLKDNGLSGATCVLLHDIYDFETFYAFSNLPNVSLVSYDAVHADAIGRGKYLVFLEKDISLFTTLVGTWLD